MKSHMQKVPTGKRKELSTMLGNIFWSGLKDTRQKFCQTMPHILWISIFLSPHLPGPTSYPLLKTTPYGTAVLSLPTYPFSRSFPGSSSIFYFGNSITPGPTLSPSLSLSCMSVLLCMRMYTHTLSSSKTISIPTTSTVNSIVKTSKCLAKS